MSVITTTSPIAVLDSGVGGLGVLREVKRVLPRENLFYFGDSANAPYGERRREEIAALVCSHAERLLSRCKALVLACNTATCAAAELLRSTYRDRPILGMEPALRPALSVGPHPRILVLATKATLDAEKFATLRRAYAPRAEICALAAPALVRLVEAGLGDSPAADAYLQRLLAEWEEEKPDAVVLGCTHFPFAVQSLQRVLGPKIPIFDGAIGTARQLARRLSEASLLSTAPRPGAVTLTSSLPAALPRYRALWAQSLASNLP